MFNKIVESEELSLIRKYTSLVKQYNDGVSLAIGEPYIDVNKKIIERTIRSLEDKQYKYCNAQGDNELLELIASDEGVDKENVLVTMGSSEGIFISLLSILNKEDEVIIINPSYPQYAPVVRFCGGVVVYVDTLETNCLPTYSSLISVINEKTKAIILNSPANPTGVLYDKQTLKMIDDIAIKNNLYILNDDVYEDILFVEKVKYKFRNPLNILLKSFSKSYGMTGYRLGYIVASNKVIEQLIKVHSYLCISLPTFTQKGAVEALKNPTINLNKIVENLNLLTEFLEENNLEYIPVDGGIFMMINIECFNMDSVSFCDGLLSEYHVACVPGICFNCEGYIRVNFAVSQEDLILSISRMQCYINGLDKR